MKIIDLQGTTTAGGALTLTADKKVVGFVEKVVYDYGDAATLADLTLTCEAEISEPIMTKADLGTADAVFYPRALGNKVADGAAFTDTVNKIFVTGTFKAVIAQGGATKDVRLLIYVSDEV